MKKLFIGCIAVIAVLMGLAGCNSERTTYEGPNYLMFPIRFTAMPYRKPERYSMYLSLLLFLPTTTVRLP